MKIIFFGAVMELVAENYTVISLQSTVWKGGGHGRGGGRWAGGVELFGRFWFSVLSINVWVCFETARGDGGFGQGRRKNAE